MLNLILKNSRIGNRFRYVTVYERITVGSILEEAGLLTTYSKKPVLKKSFQLPTVPQIMEKRLEFIVLAERFPELKEVSDFWLQKICTSDSIIYYEDKVKIIYKENLDIVYNPKKQNFSELAKNLSHGALLMSPRLYYELEGPEFTRKELEQAGIWYYDSERYRELNEYLSKEEAKNHPIWKTLARDDEFLSKYIDRIFPLLHSNKYGNPKNKGLGILLIESCPKEPNLRSWVMEGGVNNYLLDGFTYFGEDNSFVFGYKEKYETFLKRLDDYGMFCYGGLIKLRLPNAKDVGQIKEKLKDGQPQIIHGLMPKVLDQNDFSCTLETSLLVIPDNFPDFMSTISQ